MTNTTAQKCNFDDSLLFHASEFLDHVGDCCDDRGHYPSKSLGALHRASLLDPDVMELRFSESFPLRAIRKLIEVECDDRVETLFGRIGEQEVI